MTDTQQFFSFISAIETPQNKYLMESIRAGFKICYENSETTPDAEPQTTDETAVDSNTEQPQEDETTEQGTEETAPQEQEQEPAPEPPPPADPDATATEVNEVPTPEQINVSQFANEFVKSGHVGKAIENMKSEVANGSKLTEELLKKKIAYEMGVFCNEKNYATIGEDNIAELTNKIVAILKRNKQ